MALLNTSAKKVMRGAAPGRWPRWRRSCSRTTLLQLLATGCVAAIGAIGLNLVTGYAGQVSLGHAFFLGVGAYTAAVDQRRPGRRARSASASRRCLIWLPAAGLVAGPAGVIVAPLATRLRGLYLAIVTLGLVFIGEHVFREWSELTGGVGRRSPGCRTPVLFGVRLSTSPDVVLTGDQKLFWLMLVLLVVFALGGPQPRPVAGRPGLHRHPRPGHRRRRSWASNLRRGTRRSPSRVSSFYAGCAGALLYVDRRLLRPGLVQPAAVGAVHRDGPRSAGRARSPARSWARSSSRCCPA